MLFSIITVVYNEVETIERTIKSVINQTYSDYEYIIIDGNSSDGTVDIIKKYDSKISYWVSENDDGLYYAMNKGIAIAKGDYLSFLNANDWYEEDALDVIREGIMTSHSAIYYGKVRKYVNGQYEGYIGISEVPTARSIFFENLYCHQGLFIKKEMFRDIGIYDTSYRALADYDWILKAKAYGIEPRFIEHDIANYTMGGVSDSELGTLENNMIVLNNIFKMGFARGREILIGKMIFELSRVKMIEMNFVSFFNKYRGIYLWGCGYFGQELYDMLKNQCDVLGFVDSYSELKEKSGLRIYSPVELIRIINKEENYVMVGTLKGEEEIVNNLKSMKINKYIRLSDFFYWIYENFYNMPTIRRLSNAQ